MANLNPKKSSKTPEEWQLMLQQAREISRQRREANRMSPEEFAAFKAWNKELDKQMLSPLMSTVREQRRRERQAKSSTEA